jgi:hypothetical protein
MFLFKHKLLYIYHPEFRTIQLTETQWLIDFKSRRTMTFIIPNYDFYNTEKSKNYDFYNTDYDMKRLMS